MRFHLVGAFDRHNYGDILFPLIHTEFISRACRSDFEVSYYSVKSSDMRLFGGFETLPLCKLLETDLDDRDRVVIVGGEVLAADWVSMISNHVNPIFRYPLQAVKKVFGYRLGNELVRVASRACGEYPYVLRADRIGADIHYSSVGGTALNKWNEGRKAGILRRLKDAAHVSVRDELSASILREGGVHVDIVPDSAFLMSDFFDTNFLRARSWSSNVSVNDKFSFDKYYSFQISKYYAIGVIDAVCREMKSVYDRTGASVMLVPIGYASGHEDNIVLESIFDRLAEMGVPSAILRSMHVLDIMAAVAFSVAYVGTSLHGAITSFSFGHKVCGICGERVRKVAEYIKTWMPSDDAVVRASIDFSEVLVDWLSRGECSVSLEEIGRQKSVVYEDLAKYL